MLLCYSIGIVRDCCFEYSSTSVVAPQEWEPSATPGSAHDCAVLCTAGLTLLVLLVRSSTSQSLSAGLTQQQTPATGAPMHKMQGMDLLSSMVCTHCCTQGVCLLATLAFALCCGVPCPAGCLVKRQSDTASASHTSHVAFRTALSSGCTPCLCPA
jgi:hypothetical protein